MQKIKKIVIISFSIIIILTLLTYISLEYVGSIIFDSLINNEYNNLNAQIENSIEDEETSLNSNNNVNVDVSNSNIMNNTENINSDNTQKEEQKNTDSKTPTANENSEENINTNSNVSDNLNNTKEKENNQLSNISSNSESFSNIENYINESTKKEIKEKDEESSQKENDKLFEPETVKEIKDSVENKDKVYVATKVITKISKSELAKLLSMLSGGITLEEKIEAVKIVQKSFNEKEVEEIRSIYHKYIDQLESSEN